MAHTQGIPDSEAQEGLIKARPNYPLFLKMKVPRYRLGRMTKCLLFMVVAIVIFIFFMPHSFPASDLQSPPAHHVKTYSSHWPVFYFNSTHRDLQALGIHVHNTNLLEFCEKIISQSGPPLPGDSTRHAIKEVSTLPELVGSLPEKRLCVVTTNVTRFASLMAQESTFPDHKFYGQLTQEILGTDQSDQTIEEFQRKAHQNKIGPVLLSVFRGAHVNSLGHVINESVYFAPKPSCGREMREWPKADEEMIVEKVFVMRQSRDTSFYHALIEDIPRLVPYLDELLVRPDIKIAIRDDNRRRELLKILGFDASRFINGPPIRAEIVFFPEPSVCNDSDPLHMRLLAQQLIKSLGLKNVPRRPKQLVVIRRRRKRFILNFDELLEMIKSNHPEFAICIFDEKDNLPTADALRLFYHASIIVGPHGAGLANMIMAGPGSQIVEFQHESAGRQNWMPCFQKLAASMGFGYHMTICKHGKFEGPIPVDMNTASKMLRNAVNDLETFNSS